MEPKRVRVRGFSRTLMGGWCFVGALRRPAVGLVKVPGGGRSSRGSVRGAARLRPRCSVARCSPPTTESAMVQKEIKRSNAEEISDHGNDAGNRDAGSRTPCQLSGRDLPAHRQDVRRIACVSVGGDDYSGSLGLAAHVGGYIQPHAPTRLGRGWVLGGFIVASPGVPGVRPAGANQHSLYVIAAAQMLSAGLLIHLTGGRLETHFHVFGSLAFLAFYRDWRVLGVAIRGPAPITWFAVLRGRSRCTARSLGAHLAVGGTRGLGGVH